MWQGVESAVTVVDPIVMASLCLSCAGQRRQHGVNTYDAGHSARRVRPGKDLYVRELFDEVLGDRQL